MPKISNHTDGKITFASGHSIGADSSIQVTSQTLARLSTDPYFEGLRKRQDVKVQLDLVEFAMLEIEPDQVEPEQSDPDA